MNPTLFAAIVSVISQLSVESLKVQDDAFALLTRNQTLLKVSEHSIELAGKIELGNKLQPTKSSQSHTVIDQARLLQLFHELTPSIIRLNHLGIGYPCLDIKQEVATYQAQLKETDFHLYEEPSESPTQRWLFVGNRTDWQDPLFELVLTHDDWPPQFQIDLDTKLSFEELETLVSKYLRKDFFSWKLDIPNYGVVLAMGKLGEVSGTEIYLGLGTNLRNTEMHRNQILKDI